MATNLTIRATAPARRLALGWDAAMALAATEYDRVAALLDQLETGPVGGGHRLPGLGRPRDGRAHAGHGPDGRHRGGDGAPAGGLARSSRTVRHQRPRRADGPAGRAERRAWTPPSWSGRCGRSARRRPAAVGRLRRRCATAPWPRCRTRRRRPRAVDLRVPARHHPHPGPVHAPDRHRQGDRRPARALAGARGRARRRRRCGSGPVVTAGRSPSSSPVSPAVTGAPAAVTTSRWTPWSSAARSPAGRKGPACCPSASRSDRRRAWVRPRGARPSGRLT